MKVKRKTYEQKWDRLSQDKLLLRVCPLVDFIFSQIGHETLTTKIKSIPLWMGESRWWQKRKYKERFKLPGVKVNLR